MLNVKVEKENGENLQITGREEDWQLASVDGLDPSKGKITTKELANWDGSVYSDSRVEERDITLELYVNGTAEEKRDLLFSFFQVSKYIKLYFSAPLRKCYIEGYVESCKIDTFKMHQVMQIGVLCPSPFFVSSYENKQQLSNTLGGFYFPFAIEKEGIEFTSYEEGRRVTVFNYGEISTGAIFDINFLGDCTNPVIYNRETGEYMQINSSFGKGDNVEINTTRGRRTIFKKDGDLQTNLINYLSTSSTWLQLKPGRSYFSLKADSGVNFINVIILNSTYYQGV